ncbi:hypothetical protein VNO78_07833 [Psophocarpus tetragonolobus]|uniref:Uncharacterized protein n=1 Tax=Psophocarpus tetragonolobus TaxID=3891 RepID=A0AAN9STY5_PSOTE
MLIIQIQLRLPVSAQCPLLQPPSARQNLAPKLVLRKELEVWREGRAWPRNVAQSQGGHVLRTGCSERSEEGRKEAMADLLAWLISFFLLIALLVLVTYQLMCLADLEFDYINPYDSASRINMVIFPEFIIQAVLCFFYLITRHWVMTLFCVPYLFHNIRLYRQRRHLVDVTEIFNLLTWEKKQRLVKLFYLVLTLFLSVFWMIYTSLEGKIQGRDCLLIEGKIESASTLQSFFILRMRPN